MCAENTGTTFFASLFVVVWFVYFGGGFFVDVFWFVVVSWFGFYLRRNTKSHHLFITKTLTCLTL